METLLFAESISFAKKNLWWSIFRSSRLVYGIENNRRNLLYSWSEIWWKFPLQVYGEDGLFYCCGIDQKVIKKSRKSESRSCFFSFNPQKLKKSFTRSRALFLILIKETSEASLGVPSKRSKKRKTIPFPSICDWIEGNLPHLYPLTIL